MAIPTGKLANYARDEFPATWDAIDSSVTGGEDLLERRVQGAMIRFFGAVMSETEQDALDERVIAYVGKVITLSLINAGIDYWSKQRISVGARSEAITFKDRAEDLHRLREALLLETREMWLEVEPLLNVINSTVVTSRRSRMRVTEVTTALTPDPYRFGEKLDEAEIIPLPRRVIQ
jgi:hypothetical protein